MKILLLSMTCGEGHNSIAKSVKNYLESRDVECKIVDIYRSDKNVKNSTMMHFFGRLNIFQIFIK